MEWSICEKFLNLISDTHYVHYPVSLSSHLFVFLHMDTSIYLSLCYFWDSCFSRNFFFFLFMKETEKLVRAQTGMRESSCRGRLSAGTARRRTLEDMGKRETPPRGKKGKGAEKKDRAKFKITFRQPRTCVSIQMLTTSACNLLPLVYRPPLLQQKPTEQHRSPPRSFLSSASLPLMQFDYR